MYEITIKSAFGTTVETVATRAKLQKRLDRLKELGIEEVSVHRETNPCVHCDKRYPGCHSHCPDGITYSQHVKENKAMIKAERNKAAMIGRYEAVRITKRGMG